jgi:hypothetical protein
MGVLEQPTAFFGGGFKIQGDLEISGEVIQDPPIRFGIGTETLDDTLAIGVNSKALGEDSLTIGRNSEATRQKTVAIGEDSKALGINATSIGAEATAVSNWNTAIGYDAGSLKNGENIVLIGRKVEARGDDSVAIGESARANGIQSIALGKASSALGKNSSVFGKDASVTGDNSIAFGVGAEVTAENSVALGTNVTVNKPDIISFGNRDINLSQDNSILYPDNNGISTLANLNTTSAATAGSTQSYSLEINSKPLFTVASDADGSGGIQNKRIQFNGNIISDSTVIWNSSQNHIPISSLQNNSITVTAGSNLSGGGKITLGQSQSINLNLSDISGKFLTVDNQDEIAVSIGKGLKPSTSNSIEFDESVQYSFTDKIDFQSSIKVSSFQDIEKIESDPPSPADGVARLFVDGGQTPAEVKIIDSKSDVTTVVTLSN